MYGILGRHRAIMRSGGPVFARLGGHYACAARHPPRKLEGNSPLLDSHSKNMLEVLELLKCLRLNIRIETVQLEQKETNDA